MGTLDLGKVKLFEHPNDWDTCTPPFDAVPGLMVQLERSKLIDNKRGHSNTELYSAFLGAFDQFPWKTSNQLSAPMVPAIKDIQNLKSAHLIGKPEFGAVIESDVFSTRILHVRIVLIQYFVGIFLGNLLPGL